MKVARTQLDGSAAGLRAAASTVTPAMAKIGKGVTLVGVGVAIAATKMAGDFQAETAVLQTAAGETSKGLKTVRAGILDIAKGTGTGIKDLTDGMYTIEKAGFRGAEGLKILKAAAQGAREENAKLSDVTNAMTSIMASYHLKANKSLAAPNAVASREMARFGLSSVDVSTKLGKRGLTGTFDLLTETILKKMGPNGQILMSAFEGTKQSAEDARIMISKLPPELRKQSQAFLDGTIQLDDWKAVVKGSTLTQQPMLRGLTTLVNRSRGFSRELKAGSPAAKTYTDALKKMTGGAIGLNTTLQLTGESAAGNKERVAKIGESFRHVTKDVEGWKTTQNLLNVQMARAKQGINVLMIEIGTKLIPVVSALVGFFVKHNTVTLVMIGLLASLLIAISAVYIGYKTYKTYMAIATAYNWLFVASVNAETGAVSLSNAALISQKVVMIAGAAATLIATAATTAFGVALAIVTSPITLVVVGIAALVAGIVYLATQTQFFQKTWSAVWGFIKKIVGETVKWLKNNWQLVIFTILTGGIGLAAAMIVRHWDQIVSGAKIAFHAVIKWAEWLGGVLVTFFTGLPGKLASFFSSLPGIFGRFFSSLPGIVGGAFVTAGKAIGTFFSELPGNIIRWTTGFNKTLIKVGGDLIGGLFSGITDFFTKTIPQIAKNVKDGVVSFFKAVFGIKSPSTVMASIGMDLIRGLLKGMLKIATSLVDWLSQHIGQPIVNLFTKTIPNAAGTFRTKVAEAWNGLMNGLEKIWGMIKRGVLDPIVNLFTKTIPNAGKSVRDALTGFIRTMALHVLDAFGSIIHGAAKIFGWVPGIGGKLKKASNAFDTFRDNVNKALGGINSKKVTVPVVFHTSGGRQFYATGGQIDGPGTETSDEVPIWASKGEHMLSAKEVKGLGGHKAVERLRAGARAGEYGYAQGGEVGVQSSVPSRGTVNSKISKAVAAIVKANAAKIFDSMIPNIGSGGGAGVKRWTATVQGVLRMLGQSLNWTATVLRRMNQESGGNPNIVNRWDSNWQAGHPSVGLMQVIRGTFNTYAGRYRRVGPFSYGVSTNPSANVYAGLNYATHRYGSLAALNRPGGYDLGGIARGVGLLAKYTNHPERVLSPRQTAAFERLVSKLPSSGGGSSALVIERLVLENHGVIGSQHELENWLVDSLDQLRRKGRIK